MENNRIFPMEPQEIKGYYFQEDKETWADINPQMGDTSCSRKGKFPSMVGTNEHTVLDLKQKVFNFATLIFREQYFLQCHTFLRTLYRNPKQAVKSIDPTVLEMIIQ